MSRILFTMAFIVLAGPGSAQYAESKPVEGPMAKGYAAISQEDCRTWLTYLASDDLGGRATGTEGHQKAADYVAARFKDFGLKPVGDDESYFQRVDLVRLNPTQDACQLAIGDRVFTGGDSLTFGACEGEAEGSVVVLRAAGRDSVLPDDVDLKGKIVVLISERAVMVSSLRRELSEHDPAALVVVGRPWRPVRFDSRQLQVAASVKKVAYIEDAVATEFLTAIGVPGEFQQPGANGPATVLTLPTKVRFTAVAERELIQAPNVVGYLEGSDADLKHEVVICGSHLDHIGTGRDGAINNGADDDGSGSTALLAVAKAFSMNGIRPKRSLLFIAVCGEELGLLGSEHYVENPIIPIKDTVCELQMDMVGRNEQKRNREGEDTEKAEDNIRSTHLVGTKKLSMDLHQIVLAANEHVGFEFEFDEESVWNRSDHYNFAKKGIPIVFVFSGFHPDYHKPTDTVDK
ncbi:MAG: M28 family peptidase, partial [Planctomycetes bacterium]|nr:M28 family peptidase [Planctomycetota bacterium]